MRRQNKGNTDDFLDPRIVKLATVKALLCKIAIGEQVLQLPPPFQCRKII